MNVLRLFLRHWWWRPPRRRIVRWAVTAPSLFGDVLRCYAADLNILRLRAHVFWGKPTHPVSRAWDRLQMSLGLVTMWALLTVMKVRWS